MLKTRHWLSLSFGLFVLFMGLVGGLQLAKDWVGDIDHKWLMSVYNIGGKPFIPLWKGVSHLGDFSFCLILTLLIGIIFAFFKKGLTGMTFMAGLIGENLLENFFKGWIAKPRPHLTHALSDGSHSFPSGHMMETTYFYGFLVLLLIYLLKKNKNYLAVSWVVIGFIVFIILQALSRLALGAHEPSDLIGGCLLGASWLCVIMAFLNKARQKGFR